MSDHGSLVDFNLVTKQLTIILQFIAIQNYNAW